MSESNTFLIQQTVKKVSGKKKAFCQDFLRRNNRLMTSIVSIYFVNILFQLLFQYTQKYKESVLKMANMTSDLGFYVECRK